VFELLLQLDLVFGFRLFLRVLLFLASGGLSGSASRISLYSGLFYLVTGILKLIICFIIRFLVFPLFSEVSGISTQFLDELGTSRGELLVLFFKTVK
jgi:hypothetical protein